jgi:hypothetical protein
MYIDGCGKIKKLYAQVQVHDLGQRIPSSGSLIHAGCYAPLEKNIQVS